MTRDWLLLRPEELFLVWWTLDLGEPPPVLDLPRPGHTPIRRAEQAAEASDTLLSRGLGTVYEPAPALAAAVRCLATAHTTVDLHCHGRDRPRYGLGALNGRSAAVAVRAGTEVLLREVTPGRVIGSLFDTLEPLPAGPGCSANVTAEDYASACAAGEVHGVPGFDRVLRDSGLRESDSATLVQAVTTRTGGGQLGATVLGARVPAPLTWLDTPPGRYAMRRHGDWVTVTPANGTRLTAMAEDLLGTHHREAATATRRQLLAPWRTPRWPEVAESTHASTFHADRPG